MLASEVLTPVSTELNDPGATRWTSSTLLAFLNGAQLAVVLARPDANSVTQAVQLAAGTKQVLPTGGVRLLDAVRNMGTDGATPGMTINMSDRKTLDLFNRNWHTATSVSTVDEVFYDWKRSPLTYYVSVPVTSSPAVWIEIALSKVPTTIAATTDPITIQDVYAPALQEWVLYRAYSLNTSSAGSQARAAAHLALFGTLLGIKTQSDAAEAPAGA